MLFILSADHGELFNAMYFMMGMPFASALAMPPRTAAIHAGSLPYPIHPYDTLDDLLKIVDQTDPDIVLLFSGYLYAANHLLNPTDVGSLMCSLRDRSLPVVTSDPSLGMLRNTSNQQVFAWREQFGWLEPWLAHLPHLYLAPDGMVGTGSSLSFFNPHLVLPEPARNSVLTAAAGQPWAQTSRPRWLFILQTEDDRIQATLHDDWPGTLAARLNDATSLEKQAVLIAPRPTAEQVLPRLQNPEHVTILGPCRYPLFMQCLHDAEVTFYWNRYSASILSRILNGQPTFSFDLGHLGRSMPAIVDIAERHFYAECNWPLLSDRVPLALASIAEMLSTMPTSLFHPVIDRLSHQPTPDRVIHDLLAQWKVAS